MTTVKFAHVCDGCGDRSDEYTPWPTCLECAADVCPECCGDTYREPDDDAGAGICPACRIAMAEDTYWDRKIHARMDGDEC